MKKNILLSVPKPCQEQYSTFTNTPHGGFCASCQKEVIDFTTWSDERIKLYFKNLKGNTCGRFREDQLKIYSYDRVSRKGMSWMSHVFAVVVLLFSSREVSGQETPRNITAQFEPERENLTAEALGRKGKTEGREVIGVVKAAAQSLPLSGVTVQMKGTSRTTMTDSLGRFRLAMPDNKTSQMIVFSLKGFKTVEYIHSAARPGREIAVEMTTYNLSNIQNALVGVLGGAVVRTWVEPKDNARDLWWWLTGRW